MRSTKQILATFVLALPGSLLACADAPPGPGPRSTRWGPPPSRARGPAPAPALAPEAAPRGKPRGARFPAPHPAHAADPQERRRRPPRPVHRHGDVPGRPARGQDPGVRRPGGEPLVVVDGPRGLRRGPGHERRPRHHRRRAARGDQGLGDPDLDPGQDRRRHPAGPDGPDDLHPVLPGEHERAHRPRRGGRRVVPGLPRVPQRVRRDLQGRRRRRSRTRWSTAAATSTCSPSPRATSSPRPPPTRTPSTARRPATSRSTTTPGPCSAARTGTCAPA